MNIIDVSKPAKAGSRVRSGCIAAIILAAIYMIVILAMANASDGWLYVFLIPLVSVVVFTAVRLREPGSFSREAFKLLWAVDLVMGVAAIVVILVSSGGWAVLYLLLVWQLPLIVGLALFFFRALAGLSLLNKEARWQLSSGRLLRVRFLDQKFEVRPRPRLRTGINTFKVWLIEGCAVLCIAGGIVFVAAVVLVPDVAVDQPRFGPYLVWVAALGSALSLDRYAKALADPSGADREKRDKRRPILLLRSFRDDSLRVKAGWFSFIKHDEISLQRFLDDRLNVYGPLKALDPPGYTREPGAGRVSVKAWEPEVERLIVSAGLIVAILGDGDGLLKEFKLISGRSLRSKTLLVIPNVSDVEIQRRWQKASRALGVSEALGEQIMQGGTLGMVLSDDSEGGLLLRARTRSYAQYRTSFYVAAEYVLGKSAAQYSMR